MKTIIFIFLFVVTSQAQYQLEQAFPDLPTFSQPTELVNSGDGTNRLYLTEQAGKIFVFQNNTSVAIRKLFLDLTDRVALRPYIGLLGLAFHPNYISNRYFYVNYTFDSAGSGSGKFIRISRFTTSSTNPDQALINSELIIHTLSWSDHALAGTLRFGPNDGYLYISMGSDTYIYGSDSSQNRYGLLGKILRIDINNTSNGLSYAIPPSNPYANGGGRGEVFAIGLRNAWKFSIDKISNYILLGDNGDHAWESIHKIVSGGNYGWPCMEGGHIFQGGQQYHDCASEIFIPPIYEYGHVDGMGSVIGGYIYRGTLFPALYGKYIYADFNSGRVFALDLTTKISTMLTDDNFYISSLGMDEHNELYICSYATSSDISDLPSRIYKLATTTQTFLSPILNYPVHQSTNIPLDVTFTWQSVNNATSYLFSLGDSAQVLLWEVPITGTSYTVPAGLLKNSTNYSWAMKSKNATQTSEYGGSNYFKTVSSSTSLPLSPPNLLKPPNGSFGIPLNVTLEWLPNSNAISYLLNVANESGTIINNLNVTGNTYQLTGLSSSTAYTWSLRAINLNEQSVLSETFLFTTMHGGGD